MSDALIDLSHITITGQASVLHRPGAVRLDDYPHLVYAPEQYIGKGICTEDNGTSVADIANELAINPDIAAVVAKFATTEAHVRDAIQYALKVEYCH